MCNFFKKNNKIIAYISLIFIAFVLGRLSISSVEFFDKSEVRQFDSDKFSYINPLLECELGKRYIAQGKPRPYVTDIENYIESEKSKRNVSEVSLYYRDLNNGPWIGIEEDALFFPASLLKVPIVMYFYKESESKPGLLQTTVTVPKIIYKSNINQLYKPEESIQQGQQYTYHQLIDYAIRYSDNDAVSLLQNISAGKHIDKIFKDLHLFVDFNAPDKNGFMSVKDYATFFRILYNTSYLSQSNSEEMLKLLSNTTFDQGIRKFIPEDIKVAHKFGEIELDMHGYSQLHDCGIVYYPSHPYILCIMTRGHDKKILANTIANLSRIVYEQIKSQIE